MTSAKDTINTTDMKTTKDVKNSTGTPATAPR
jgi:hypothetical protein